MGPSRKRPRTNPPTVDEPESAQPADGHFSPLQPSTRVADASSEAASTRDDASVHMRSHTSDIKTGGGSTKDVSMLRLFRHLRLHS